MAATTYTYSIDSDTANAKVNAAAMMKHLQDDITITIAPSHVNTSGDSLAIVMKDQMPDHSGGASALLATSVGVPDGEPLSSDVPQNVRIKEETDGLETGTHYKAKGFKMLATTKIDAAVGLKTQDFTYKIPRSVLAAQFKATTAMDGDEVEMHVAPDKIIGTSSQAIDLLDVDTIVWQSGTTVRFTFNSSPDLSEIPVGSEIKVALATNSSNNGTFVISAVDDTAKHIEVAIAARTDDTDDEATDSPATMITNVVKVIQSVIDNTALGFFLKVGAEDMGYVIGVDKDNLRVTMELFPTAAIATSAVVKQTVKMGETITLVDGMTYHLGPEKVGGSNVPKDIIVKVIYNNISATAKNFPFILSWLY